jgi:hypothetical protein
VPNREAVLLFTSANWGTTQAVWFAAINGTRRPGLRHPISRR